MPKKPTLRTRNVYVAFWLSEEESKAFDEAEKICEQHTKKLHRSDRMRDLVTKFVREMKRVQEFEV